MRTHIMPGLVGGAGAVVNDVAYSFVASRLPVSTGAVGDAVEMLRSGPLRHVGKTASALVLAYLASFAVGRKQAEQLGAGAITVIGYNVVRDLAARFAPGLPLGAYISDDLAAYIPDNGMGYAGAGYQAKGGTLDVRRGSNYRASGLAAYLPRNGMNSVRQLTNRGQLVNADPFTRTAQPQVMEGYE